MAPMIIAIAMPVILSVLLNALTRFCLFSDLLNNAKRKAPTVPIDAASVTVKIQTVFTVTYIYPKSRILLINFSLSCLLPPLSGVCSISCSQAGIPTTPGPLVPLAPKER